MLLLFWNSLLTPDPRDDAEFMQGKLKAKQNKTNTNQKRKKRNALQLNVTVFDSGH